MESGNQQNAQRVWPGELTRNRLIFPEISPSGRVDKVDRKADMFEYIEVFYKRSRRHSSLGFVSPTQFLQDWLKAQQTKETAA
jgi:transposase InsO family protein